MSTEMIVPIAFFATVFGIFYVYFTTRNSERLAMIEKGADVSMFRQNYTGRLGLKFGLLMIGTAIGILVGNLLQTATGMEEEVAFLSMIMLFGGLGLLTYYFIQRKQEKRTDSISAAV